MTDLVTELRKAAECGPLWFYDRAANIKRLLLEAAGALEARDRAIPPGFHALSDVIAETEKDPERKARLDSAREQLRRHGLVERIRQAQVEAGEQVVDEWMRDKGLT